VDYTGCFFATQATSAFALLLLSNQGTPQDSNKQRNEVKKSLQRVKRELMRYDTQVGNSGSLSQVHKAILKSTGNYLEKNGS
jgi:hypothetical protein